MTLNFMRRLDYWLGISLCSLLTLADRALRLFASKKTDNNIPKKILFIKPSEMGGILLSCPLVSQIQREYPKAEIFYLTFASNRPLLDGLSGISIQKVFTVRDGSFFCFVKDVISVVFRLRKEKIDIAFDLEFFSRFTAIMTYLSGAPKRIGFYRYTFEGLYRGELLTHKVAYNPHHHVADLFLSVGQALKTPNKFTPECEPVPRDIKATLPQFIPDTTQKRMMREKLKGSGISDDAKLFLMNPGEGRLPLREWPLENFIVLARKILATQNNYVVLVGTNGDHNKAEEMLQGVSQEGKCVNLSGKTSVPELLTLFAMAEALIVNDSGLAHLASLTEIKQYVFFGPESPSVFSPLGGRARIFYSALPCSPCLSAYNHRRSACHDNKCLQGINPQEVYDAVSIR